MILLKRKPKPSPAAMHETLSLQEELARRGQARLHLLSTHFSPSPTSDLQHHLDEGFAYLSQLGDTLQRLQVPEPGRSLTLRRPHYVVTTRDLLKGWHRLTGDKNQNEVCVLVTGAVTPDGSMVMSDMLNIKPSSQSSTYIQADPHATAILLERLHDHDQHHLHAMWHSHIMHGADATRPSEVDLRHQERLVKLGMKKTLGVIFTLDGYVRFFSTAIDFDLTIYGAHAKVVSAEPRTKIFKLNIEEADHVLEHAA